VDAGDEGRGGVSTFALPAAFFVFSPACFFGMLGEAGDGDWLEMEVWKINKFRILFVNVKSCVLLFGLKKFRHSATCAEKARRVL